MRNIRRRGGEGAKSSSGSAAASCSLQVPTISARTADHVPRSPALSGSAAGSRHKSCFASALPFRTASAVDLFCSAFFLTARSRHPLCWARNRETPGGEHRPPRSLPFSRPGRAGHGVLWEGAVAYGQSMAAAHLEPGRASVRHSRPDGGVHRLLLPPLHLRVYPALAGSSVPTQTLQLPNRLPVPVFAVVRPAHGAILLLLQELCHRQHLGTIPLLAALLFTSMSPVLHPQSHEPLLCTGEYREVSGIAELFINIDYVYCI